MRIDADAVIIGGGPCGLFQIFELGLLGIQAHLIEALPELGGQCAELYPDKPIYDIPAIPVCSAQELVDRLLEQMAPFSPTFHLGQQVIELTTEDERFALRTSTGQEFLARTVIIAGGVGAFEPVRLKLDGIEALQDSSMFYRVKDPKQHHGKHVIVLGGGDSALDWVLDLHDDVQSMTLIHRSEKFRGAPASVEKMYALRDAGKLDFKVGNITSFETNSGELHEVEVTNNDRQAEILRADQLLVFFGLSPKLGPIAHWGLGLQKNSIEVDTEKFQTNVPGIFAVGDINVYPGKKKLILSGFHEAALAAFAIKHHLNPDQKVHLQYTTTSPIMHKRLGVESPYKSGT